MIETCKRIGYLMLILLSGLVSVYDTVLTIVYWPIAERNPVGVLLIKVGGLYLLIKCKVFCTFLATFISFGLVYWFVRFRIALIGVAAAQLVLFLYLSLADNGYGGWWHFWNTVTPFNDFINFYY